MDAQNRDGRSGLSDPALADLATLEFNHVVTLLEGGRSSDERIGWVDDPRGEKLRFKASRTLGFPASEIDSIVPGSEPGSYEIRVNFLGLYGPSSPLPPFVTEGIVRDDSGANRLEAFLDFFNHRLISLLRRIWLSARYYLRYRRGGSDPISRRILALYGLPPETDKEVADGPKRDILLSHIGLLAQYSRSAETLAGLLSHYFEVPARVEEFVQREVTIPDDQRGRVGRQSLAFGRSFVLGSTVSDRLGKFRVHLGPLSFQDFMEFLPDGAYHGRLLQLVALTQRDPLAWDFALHLDKGQATPWRLGEKRLGYSLWFGGVGDVVAPVVLTADGGAGEALAGGGRDHG